MYADLHEHVLGAGVCLCVSWEYALSVRVCFSSRLIAGVLFTLNPLLFWFSPAITGVFFRQYELVTFYLSTFHCLSGIDSEDVSRSKLLFAIE